MALTTIIVGHDLSEGSDSALERAVTLAQMHRASLVVAYAQADDSPIDGPIDDEPNEMLKQLSSAHAALHVEETRLLQSIIDRLTHRGVVAESVVRSGPPAEVLAALAAERKAELIVVGTHGNTGIARFLLGSQACEVVRHAACNVLICRGPGTMGFSRPLVATDFSPIAAAALQHAPEFCVPGSELRVVHAWQLPRGSWGARFFGQTLPWTSVRDSVLRGATENATKLVAAAKTRGFSIDIELVQGPPAHVITEAAERGHHDLIVVGSHGHRGVRRFLLGSVAESTLRHAPCSVLIVHPGSYDDKRSRGTPSGTNDDAADSR